MAKWWCIDCQKYYNICVIEDKFYKSKIELHISNFHGKKISSSNMKSCPHCGVNIKDQQHMDEHMESNHPDKMCNNCESCGIYFHSIRSQARHKCKPKTKKDFQDQQTEKKQPTKSKKSPEEDVKASQWWCCHCEQNYFGILTKKIYKLHMTNYHENIQDNEENNSKKPNEKKSSHEEKSKKEWWCHFCKKYFFGVLYSVFYDMHMSNFHGGAKTKSTKSPPPDFDFGQKKSKNRDPPKSPPRSKPKSSYAKNINGKRINRKEACRILELSKNATLEEIKTAFRRLARKWHPDKNKNPEENDKFTMKFQEINGAYDVLSKCQ